MTTNDAIKRPSKAIEDAIADPNPAALVAVMDNLMDEDAVIEWHRFDEDDETTWPNDIRGRNTVLALVTWTNLRFKRPNGTPAPFYQAFLGVYRRCDDGDVRFFLDHGNGYSDEPGEEGDDWISPPPWWTYMVTPERAGLET